jgi:hypothetical protein
MIFRGTLRDQLIDDTIKYLNEVLEADRAAISKLIETRAPLSSVALYAHESVQCVPFGTKGWAVGMLGVLNGLFGKDETGQGFICAYYGDDLSTVVRFGRAAAALPKKPTAAEEIPRESERLSHFDPNVIEREYKD